MTIVVGACVTHFCGEQGEIHLRDDKAQTLANKHSAISLFLWGFRIETDDAGHPVDFVTELRMMNRGVKKQTTNGQQLTAIEEGVVRMNKPLKYHGWRFCQSNFDSDGHGVVLSYNYDPWGIGITYTGYAMLLLAMIAFFFQPRTRFRALLKKSVFGAGNQVRVLCSVFCILIIALAFVMTKVVTPKPPLQPVLQTPLLGIHVSVIMLAYTLFAVIMVNGILGLYAALVSKKAEGARKEKLSTLNSKLSTLSQILLYPALFCLTAGIFIGAVWANMSWGRYWGWDPKETWALITMLVYAAQLHWPWMKNKLPITNEKSPIIYHILSVINFLFVLFTYFGVSYLLGGVHSYA